MPTYTFDEILVWDVLPGGGVRTLRNAKVTVRDGVTDVVITTIRSDVNGLAQFESDAPYVVLEGPRGFRRRVVSEDALVAAAAASVSSDAAVAALLSDTSSASRGALGGLFTDKGSIGYAAADYGVKADGTTDDRSKMLDVLNAGRVIVLPKGGTIRLAAKLVLPPGRTIVTNGCKFIVTGALNDYAIQLTTGTTIVGGLVVETPTAGDVRGVEIVGTDITVDRLTVTAPGAGAGAGDINDCGLSIRDSARVDLGQVTVTNFDYAAKVTNSSDVDLGKLRVSTYVRGLYVSNVLGLSARGRITGASPNAIVTSGHNGVLIDATSNGATADVDLRGLSVSDSGEHGFRIGGSFTVKRVRFSACSSSNVGGSGFKVLGDTVNKHEDLTFTDCVVEDAAQAGTNGAGFMLQNVRRVKVNGPIVRRANKTYSASEGLNIQGAESVTVSDPDLSDTAERAYAVLSNLGNCTNVRLSGGRMSFNAGVGVRIDYTNATFRRVSVEGWPQIEPAAGAYAVSVLNGGGGSVIGSSWLSWQSVSAADRQVDPASVVNTYAVDVRAPFSTITPPPVFKSGSRWADATTRISNGTAWTTSADETGFVTPDTLTSYYTKGQADAQRGGVNILSRGAVAGQTSTTAIQSAIDNAFGLPVIVPAGVFPCGQLTPRSGTKLILEAGAVLDFSGVTGAGVATNAFINLAGTVGASVALTATTTANTITAPGHGLVAGDMVRLGSNLVVDSFSTQQKDGEIVFVLSVAGDVITTTTPIVGGPYTVADAARIAKITPVRDVLITGRGTIKGAKTNGAGQHGINVEKAVNVRIEDVTMRDIDQRHIRFQDAVDCHVQGVYVEWAVHSSQAYGVSFTDACQDCSVTHSTFLNVRHAFSINNDSAVDGICRRIACRFNTGRLTSVATGGSMLGGDMFDTHSAAEDIWIDYNTVIGSSGQGINHEARSGSVSWNKIRDCASEGVSVHNESDRPGRVQVIGNVVERAGARGILVRTGGRGTQAAYEQMDVSHNVAIDCAGGGLQIGQTTTFTPPERGVVAIGNTVVRCQGTYSILITNVAGLRQEHNKPVDCPGVVSITDTAPDDDPGYLVKSLVSDTLVITPYARVVKADTEGGAVSDTILNITGGRRGQVITVSPSSNARDLTFSVSGNIRLTGGTYTMGAARDSVTLWFDGTNWLELSRADFADA